MIRRDKIYLSPENMRELRKRSEEVSGEVRIEYISDNENECTIVSDLNINNEITRDGFFFNSYKKSLRINSETFYVIDRDLVNIRLCIKYMAPSWYDSPSREYSVGIKFFLTIKKGKKPIIDKLTPVSLKDLI